MRTGLQAIGDILATLQQPANFLQLLVIAGALLLGIPYLLAQVPLMLVDVPAMFFLTLAVFMTIRARWLNQVLRQLFYRCQKMLHAIV